MGVHSPTIVPTDSNMNAIEKLCNWHVQTCVNLCLQIHAFLVQVHTLTIMPYGSEIYRS